MCNPPTPLRLKFVDNRLTLCYKIPGMNEQSNLTMLVKILGVSEVVNGRVGLPGFGGVGCPTIAQTVG
jgi:hypothetical protein